jgi:hypothetical protein
MKPHKASAINALLLIFLGLWSYLNLESRPITALIPVIFGGILFLFYSGIKKENKLISHLAVTLTLVILIGLLKPLFSAIERGNTAGVVRVAVMLFSTVFALVTFIRSFIQARKNRANQS